MANLLLYNNLCFRISHFIPFLQCLLTARRQLAHGFFLPTSRLTENKHTQTWSTHTSGASVSGAERDFPRAMRPNRRKSNEIKIHWSSKSSSFRLYMLASARSLQFWSFVKWIVLCVLLLIVINSSLTLSFSFSISLLFHSLARYTRKP